MIHPLPPSLYNLMILDYSYQPENMDHLPIFFLSISVLAISLLSLLRLAGVWRPCRGKLPPGPIPLPIIGSLFQLAGAQPHRSLATLAKTHGPLMALKLGSITTIVASSPAAAREVLQKHDHDLSGRWVPDALRSLNYHEMSLAWSQPNQNWRNMRKFFRTHLASPKRLDASRGLRRQKVRKLVEFLRRNGGEMDISQAVHVTALNLISNTLFSIDVAGFGSESAQGIDFKRLIRGLLEEIGKPNMADFFPWLRFLDPQGRRRLFTGHLKKLHELFDEMISSRQLLMQSTRTKEEPQDLLDVLLHDFRVEGTSDSKLYLQTIKSFLTDIILAGSDTSATTVEWALAELMRKPPAMAKAQQELTVAISSGDDQDLDESDISRLPYLQAVVKETLRLHPPAPLLGPHRAEAAVDMWGYVVPKHAQVLVNAWAIGRDAEVWKDPESFIPERFLGMDIDFQGQDFELLPFGSGRRMCPGMPLANRTVHLMLASLLRWFNWKLPNGMNETDIDMREKFGITLAMEVPLQAVPTPR